MKKTESPDLSSRRKFVKNASLALGGIAALSPISFIAMGAPEVIKGKKLVVTPNPEGRYIKPLESIEISGAGKGVITVRDGAGNEYFRRPVNGKAIFKAAGALGTHFVTLESEKGKLLDTASFRVDCKTEINDAGDKYHHLLGTLYHTMIGEYKREAEPYRLNGKTYFVFVSWLRDHVHTMKGMKYFYAGLKSGIDMYADFQREDGMVWDNIYTRDQEKNWWDKRFSYGNFILPVENETYEFHRIPVEADVEYLFIEGIYYTWKATGDTAWMRSRLDNALQAVKYVTNSSYRWSTKYQLVKRGFTIDTWDFQANEDTLLTGGDIMVIDKDKTRFGVMFGDNTGMAISCEYLAEMLDIAGRKQEADSMHRLGEDLLKRLNALSWNGKYYTHHVPEDPTVKRDFGIDQSKQVTLSNSYSINRGITHQQAVAIIKTYQKIKQEMPATSPAEWYSVYPPFRKGFGIKDASAVWEYMNGGVTPIVGGELAHGAFEHGFEAYGVDILDRIAALAAQTGDYLHCTYRGAMPDNPPGRFTSLTLKDVANINYPGKDVTFNGKWIGETPGNKASATMVFHEVPFEILNPDFNKNTCIEVNDTPGNLPKAILPVNQKAASVYLLHTMTPGKFAGTVNFFYTDGTVNADYITEDKIGHWWRIENEHYSSLVPTCKKAWRSNNDKYVAFYIYGINNPEPERVIEKIEFVGAKQSQKWQVLAVTLSDYKVFFPPSKISYGIPDNWGSAAVVYALVEGLVGVKDTGVAFNKALLAPRWEAAGVNEVTATVKYEASGGYLSYQYKISTDKKSLDLLFTGTAYETTIEILLPTGKDVISVFLNSNKIALQKKQIEQSNYIVLHVKGIGAHRVNVALKGLVG
jgi:hypothetical protein